MSNYTQEQETEIVLDAMTLTTAIKIENAEIQRLMSESFRRLPAKPVLKEKNPPQKVQPQIPAPPQAKYGFSEYLAEKNLTKGKLMIFCLIGAALFGLFPSFGFGPAFFAFWIISIIVLAPSIFIFLSIVIFCKCSEKRKALELAAAQSPEYLAEVENAKAEAVAQTEKNMEEYKQWVSTAKAKYEAELENYNTVIVPAYNKEFAHWKEVHQKKIAMLQEDRAVNEKTLAELYDTTKIISVTYRELWILRWLYDDMKSSDHDIRYATELLDRNRQRLATEQSGRMVREAVQDMQSAMEFGFQDVYEAVEAGNDSLAEIRQNQHRANTVGIIQRHNLNKMTKEQNKILKEHFEGKK